ncbi:hypothetical protein AMS68_002242 [Peltaster fructicola]|uniref:Xylanolytic transcriptional activator regulatory domain-containing protein n=1 Tax=Peltaster fructicola TaxID=286661 RepID=A0A6H0XQ14_9PEZI|nr:hypothetical protein AMS68_002242 [Peltaster fructicola]
MILFWAIYYLDHTLSLRLGRPSTIHDIDITVDLPERPSEETHRAWSEWFRVLIEIARLHGLVYEKLYSPASFSKTHEERLSVSRHLDSWLRRISVDNASIAEHPVHRKQHMSLLLKSNAIVIGCLLTLTHRAASTGQRDGQALHINEACLEAARATIRGHLDIVSNSSTQTGSSASDCVHWRMLNCPSTPFLVLFSHVIFSCDQSDLDLLGAFVASLDTLASNLVVRQRESIDLFLQLCKPFYTLANHYVRASRQQPDTNHKDLWSSNTLEGHMPTYLDTNTLTDPNFSFLPPELFDAWLAGTQDLDLFDWPSIDMTTHA